MAGPRHPLRGHGRVRLPYPAELLAYQLKAVKHQVPHTVQFIIAVFPDFRNSVAVPQICDAEGFLFAAFLCPSATGVVAVFPLLTPGAAVADHGCRGGTLSLFYLIQ